MSRDCRRYFQKYRFCPRAASKFSFTQESVQCGMFSFFAVSLTGWPAATSSRAVSTQPGGIELRRPPILQRPLSAARPARAPWAGRAPFPHLRHDAEKEPAGSCVIAA